MSRWKFMANAPALYSSYLNKETGTTLYAEPGQTYDIEPAEGTEWVAQPEEEGGEATTHRPPVPPPGPWERVRTTTTTPAASSSDKKDKE